MSKSCLRYLESWKHGLFIETAALVAVTGTPAAFGASPQVNHFRDVSTDVDPDFCGTGQQIDLVSTFRVNEWQERLRRGRKTPASDRRAHRTRGGRLADPCLHGDQARACRALRPRPEGRGHLLPAAEGARARRSLVHGAALRSSDPGACKRPAALLRRPRQRRGTCSSPPPRRWL
jgi:hypothetical protein